MHSMPASAQAAYALSPAERAHQLQHALSSSSVLGAGNGTNVSHQLQTILAAPEFASNVRAPTALDNWLRQLALWFADQLKSLVESAARHPTTSQFVFWAVALAALALIAMCLFRLFHGNSAPLNLSSNPPVTVPASASEWVTAARAAASRGDLNQGIQCLYWAAVVHLQSDGVLPRAGSHTPREFLRALPPSNAHEFRTLTLAVERFWYAHNPAVAADFSTCLQSLEALGCKLD